MRFTPPLSLRSAQINFLHSRYLLAVLLDQTCPSCTVCPRLAQAMHLDLRPDDDAIGRLLLFSLLLFPPKSVASACPLHLLLASCQIIPVVNPDSPEQSFRWQHIDTNILICWEM